ncbi:hypothetical protein TTHERM_01228900 (macronuclear) [Tetrahymena thermophila SB210]|uniref:Kinase domain protein n=1 Tax=Tetrahymena thermophila (strain SB210) TaxID=312017 RepID=Q22AG9_TETTS|nr:hypothetical protein TTHERM_01228900 [Tetrahymena thermophila SB210]EAR82273.1 hypothetical protein TTHERM_01228900 [Tetrahymena thermophila SB210]|eukprot:XP_001029936.1 hypothetical protein TTHERM_01228900 [Tetrahymena thermophila SB210]
MILTITNKIKDFQSLLINVNEKVSKLEINFKKATFVQENGINQFMSNLSKFADLNHLTINLIQQSLNENTIQSLSQVIQSLNKLESFSFESSKQDLSALELNYLLSSLGNHSRIQNLSIKATYCSNQERSLTVFKHIKHSKSLKNFKFSFQDKSKVYDGVFKYEENLKIMILNITNILLDESEIQSLSLFIQNKKELESFKLYSYDSNQSSEQIKYLFSAFEGFSKIQDLEFEIPQNNSVIKESLSLFKHLSCNNSLKTIKFSQEGNSFYYINKFNEIYFCLDRISLNDFDASSLSLFFKGQDTQKIKIALISCTIQASQYNSFFNFFQDNQYVQQLILSFDRQKVSSEQFYAIIQCLKQSKSLKQLKIEIMGCKLEKQVNEALSYQLSQLENIVSLKHLILYDEIDTSSFIDQIIKSKSLQELEIYISHLEQNGDYHLKTQKLLSMPNLKKLKLNFNLENNNGNEQEFFKDLDIIKQTNLQQLTIQLYCGISNENVRESYANIGKYLNKQQLIYCLNILVNDNYGFELSVILMSQFINSNITSITFNFTNEDRRYYIESSLLNKLQLQTIRKMKKVVSLKFS